MRSLTIILLCLSWVVLKPSLSIMPYPTRDFPTSNFPPDGDEIYVVGQSPSSISLLIKLGESVENRLTGTRVRYRQKLLAMAPSTLIWNSSLGYYVAKESETIVDSGEVGHRNYRQSASPSRQEKIVIGNLRFPGIKYALQVTSYRENNTYNRKTLVVRTSPVRPSNPPKTGTGCFHVSNANSSRRNVHIYWPHAEDHYTQYDVLAYEKNDETTVAAFLQAGLMRAGYIHVNISLKRHYFIFRGVNEAGNSENSSIVEVPAQKDILPALSMEVFKSMPSDTRVLSWTVPWNAKVTSYTVAWVDTFNGGVQYVEDFVYISNQGNMFQVKGKANARIGLAVSVNTETGSSGLHPAEYSQQNVWTFE